MDSGPEEAMDMDLTTREFCARCHSINAVGFHAPTDTWEAVAGRWRNSILCLRCFAQLGDEKGVQWEVGMRFYPVSLVSHYAEKRPGLVDVGEPA